MPTISVRYQDLFKFRSIWMGFAILWVMLYHSDINLAWLADWKFFGYGGVDIFFFASGLGCYYSLQKQPDPVVFLGKRAKRILPPYYIVLTAWFALQIFLYRVSITPLEVLTNVFCTGSFCNARNQFNWYVSGVWPSYLLAPLLATYANRTSGMRRLLPVPLLFLLSITFLPSSWNLMLVTSRLPTFYIGMLFAKAAQEKPTVKLRTLVCWMLLILPGAAILLYCNSHAFDAFTTYGLWWYPFLLITPGLCIALSLLCLAIQRFCRWPIKILETLGGCSFELYLVHLTVYGFLTYLKESSIYQPNNTLWCGTVFACCILALGFRKAMNHIFFPAARRAAP